MYYYFELRSQLYSREKNQSLSISLDEIQNLWNVTSRNVKYRLRKLVDEGYIIKYQPGHGRGNISNILYCNHFQHDVFDYVGASSNSRSFGKIFELFDLSIPTEWIMSSFGQSLELQNELKLFCNNIIKYNVNLDLVDSLNPFLLWNQHEAAILAYIGDTLFLYDEISKNIRPNIVHHWKSNDSYKKWNFHIRKGVKFHNNMELTAYDIAWSLEQYKKYQRSPSWILNSIKEIKCISDYKFEIELERPVYWLDRYLAWPNLIICKENTGLGNQLPVMSGVYKILKNSDDQIQLESNKQYYKGQALIDKVEIDNSKFNISGCNTGKDNSKTRNCTYKKVLHSGVNMLCFNFWKDTIIQNRQFREAIEYILDFEKMKNYFQDGIFEEAGTFATRNRKKIKKDPVNILDLVKESGYKGEQLVVHCISFKICSTSDANFVEYFDKEAKKYGINLCFEIVSYDDYIKGKSRAEADMFYGPDTPFGDYWTSFIALFHDIGCLPSMFLSENHLSNINSILNINPVSSSKSDLEDKIESVENYIRSENLVIFLLHIYKPFNVDNQLMEFKLGKLGHPLIKDMWIDE